MFEIKESKEVSKSIMKPEDIIPSWRYRDRTKEQMKSGTLEPSKMSAGYARLLVEISEELKEEQYQLDKGWLDVYDKINGEIFEDAASGGRSCVIVKSDYRNVTPEMWDKITKKIKETDFEVTSTTISFITIRW